MTQHNGEIADKDEVIAQLTVVPDYSGHTDSSSDEDAGAVAALVIGCILLAVVGAFMLYNYLMMKKGREMNSARNGGRPKILVNQSSAREDD